MLLWRLKMHMFVIPDVIVGTMHAHICHTIHIKAAEVRLENREANFVRQINLEKTVNLSAKLFA